MLARSPEGSTKSAPRAARPASERSAIFRTAERHSRIVRTLKIALPVVAVVMAALFIAQSYRSTPSTVEISSKDSAVAEGKLVMANPKLEGFTPEDRPYSMSALRAVQDIANEAVIELQEIAATLPLDDKTSATIQAPRGIFDQTANTLNLDSEINVTTSDGAVAKLSSALIDIGAGRMTTANPVEIRAKGASIQSGGMSVEQNGKVVVFEKRVRVNIVPPKTETASQ